MNVITVGEVLWDIVGQEEHLGGATFNFSAHLSRLGHKVSFISGVGADELGQKIIDPATDRMPSQSCIGSTPLLRCESAI